MTKNKEDIEMMYRKERALDNGESYDINKMIGCCKEKARKFLEFLID